MNTPGKIDAVACSTEEGVNKLQPFFGKIRFLKHKIIPPNYEEWPFTNLQTTKGECKCGNLVLECSSNTSSNQIKCHLASDMKPQLLRNDLIYPELSYKLVGYAFAVWDELGPGHSEKTYQRAYAIMLRKNAQKFEEQVYYGIRFKGELASRGFLDFRVENLVIVELKKDDFFSKTHIEQVLDYIERSNLKLGIIFNFTRQGVRFKRIVNIKAVSPGS